MSLYTVQFTLSLNTSACDPEALDDLAEQVREGVERMLEKTFPSGDCGPNQSLAEVYSLKVT